LADPTTALAPGDVAGLLRAAGATVRAELAGLPPAAARWHPAPGEWCVKEVVGHLIEAERRGFAGRIRQILERESPELETWDQDAVARARRDCERELAGLLDEFAAEREASVALVRGLRPADLPRGGQHPKVGSLAVADLLHEWVHHDRNHIRQILANVQGFAWPHMGNAQASNLMRAQLTSPSVVLGRRRPSTYAAYASERLLPASSLCSLLGPAPWATPGELAQPTWSASHVRERPRVGHAGSAPTIRR